MLKTLHRGLFILLMLTLGFNACNKKNAAKKDINPEKQFEQAKKYYEKKEYFRAGQILDELLVVFKGDARFQETYMMYAYTKFYQSELLLSSYHFKNFYESFSTHPRAEEALFMHVRSNFLDASPYYLDPLVSQRAIESIQLFINIYPESDKVNDCNQYLDDLRGRLRKKSLESAKLYMRMEDYRAAMLAFQNTVKDFPEVDNKDEIQYWIVKCAYLLAEGSVISKQEERLNTVIKEANEFREEFGIKSKFWPNVEGYANSANKILKTAPLNKGLDMLSQRKYLQAAQVLKEEHRKIDTGEKDHILALCIEAYYKAAVVEGEDDIILLNSAVIQYNLFKELYGISNKYHSKSKKYHDKAKKKLEKLNVQ